MCEGVHAQEREREREPAGERYTRVLVQQLGRRQGRWREWKSLVEGV